MTLPSLRMRTCGKPRRAAYEAVELLRFLQEFKAGTSRPVVVFGNERYGRDWIVQPLERYLRDDFDIRYWRVQSHSSMRLTVPHWIGRWNRSGFPPEFWEEMSDTQPHIFVVDECSPRRTEQYSKFARGVRDMLNWFMVFNDIRAQGDSSAYVSESTLPAPPLPGAPKVVRVRHHQAGYAALRRAGRDLPHPPLGAGTQGGRVDGGHGCPQPSGGSGR